MTPEISDPFEAALAALLEPLAQAMVAHGVTIAAANEAMKKALLKAALEISDEAMSDSRASLLTGIHRKDIKRLRHLSDENPLRQSSNAAALVISLWATDPNFQDKSGAARDLARKGSANLPGFDDAVRLTRIDMAAGTVLQLMLDQGVVAAQAGGTYRLLTHAFLPKAGSKEQVAAYQATLSAHMQAATHNLLAKENAARHFDRAVRYSHLSDAAIATLQSKANDGAQELLQNINILAQDLQQKEQGGAHEGRFVLGAYILPQPKGEQSE
ncbi:MAG: hypothetical protein JKX69_15360 [Rhodobacteraceae bacterium]|nr:hypothetical protein [Paracoccaceae bacterium]PHR54558.1 MAG: hypothetical protein COA47_15355 [Robiginitomaculum sp.]